MKLSEFKFDLPSKLIASHPAKERDLSRLMVVNREAGTIEHHTFKDIINYFNEKDVLIFNNTKVFPARMYGNKEKTGAVIEVFLLRELNAQMRLWDVLVDPARKIRVGNKLYFGKNDELVAEVIDNTTSRGRTIRFMFEGTQEELRQILYELGETPIPKELGRDVEKADEERYQTIFAKNIGAVAAPSAGLHFSRSILKRLELKGCEFAEITLHTGLGAFRSVEVEDLTKHKSESENFIVNQETCDIVNRAIDNKQRICAVGTTVMRAIESSVSSNKHLKEQSGWTDKFIFPPYHFNIANCMLTNFHVPESTLLMTTSAFLGHDLMKEAYQIAMKEEYKFFTYGDAMLIL